MKKNKFRFLMLAVLFFTALAVRATAYVGYDGDKRVLIFFCSDKKYTPGSTFGGYSFKYLWEGDDVVNSKENAPSWRARCFPKKVIFDESFKEARPKRCAAWFVFSNDPVEVIEGLEYLNTSETISMSRMFAGCRKLESIDLSHFDTKNVKSMYNMFANCRNLKSLDLSTFDTSNVTSLSSMFHSCSNLVTLDLSSFDTSKVMDSSYMFIDMEKLQTIYVGEKWNTKNTVQNAYSYHMFDDCPNLRGPDGKDYSDVGTKRRLDYAGEGGLLTLKVQ